MAEAQVHTAAPHLPRIAKSAMSFQVWLLRQGLMGSLADEIMVITVTGRKTGRPYSTPIGFLCDGETIITPTLSLDGRGRSLLPFKEKGRG